MARTSLTLWFHQPWANTNSGGEAAERRTGLLSGTTRETEIVST
jgi:hypothetical protein